MLNKVAGHCCVRTIIVNRQVIGITGKIDIFIVIESIWYINADMRLHFTFKIIRIRLFITPIS